VALEKYEKYSVADFDKNLTRYLGQVGLAEIDTQRCLGEFSGGQQQKIALAAILAARQDLILLDEPTNSLDEASINTLENHINNSPAAFVTVSHDRRFLRSTATRIIELLGERGMRQYNLGYDEYINARTKEKMAEQNRFEQFKTEKKRLQKAAKEARIKANSAASTKAKNDGDKLNANYRKERATVSLGKEARSINSRIDNLDVIVRPEEDFSLDFEISGLTDKKSSGINIEDLLIKYDNGKKIGPVNFNIQIGDRVALLGDNGVGKTSILRALVNQSTGEISGKITINEKVEVTYIDQNQSLPLPRQDALENLQNLTNGVPLHDQIILLLKFGIKKTTLKTTPVNKMSGGERMKILLAAAAANKSDMIILDEPTNNLDIPTIQGLAEALSKYKGGLLVVTHDREFLKELKITKTVSLD
jgi:ATPase subunit of ABC transporter with duplicated ATPase domains